PHGDAVTFDYEVMACLDADLHRADVMPSRAHGLRPTPERRSSVAHRHEKAARFEFGEAQLHRRPGGGRDPGKKRRARRAEAYRGRGAVSLLPALRTVRAVLPHTALRSVVIYIEIGAQERELAIG